MALVTKNFSDIITFTRASTGTYFDSNGVLQTAGNNVPRLDYNPSTLAAQGLLIEEARTNLLTYSQSFRNRTLTVSGTSGTFLNGETVTSTGGGGGIYVLAESTPTSFALYNTTGFTFSGTLTGTTSGATATINAVAAHWSNILNAELALPINSQLAPDGTMSAQVLSPTTAGSQVRYLGQQYTTSTTGNYTFSVFVKAGTGPTNNQVALIIRDQTNSNNVRANFNLSTLAVPTISALGPWTVGVATVTPCQNGWVRLSISGTANTAFTSLFSEIFMGGYQGTAETIGNFYIWGAQLEAGAFPTSYIPTTVAAVTRNADQASVNTLSPWYNSTQGTLYAEAQISAGVGSSPAAFASLDDTTTANRIQVRRAAPGNLASFRMVSSAGGIDVTLASGTLTGVNKTAAAFTASDQNAVNNGTLFTGIISITSLPTVTRLLLGDGAGSLPLNGWLRRVTYYPRRLSNAELQAITA